jgi:hypothetical protein
MIFEIQKGWVEREKVQEWTVQFPMVIITTDRVVSLQDGRMGAYDKITIQPIDHIIRKITNE